MAWSDDAWKAIEDIYDEILKLDFVRELGEGTLDSEKFVEYMEQDKLYLNDYARALALIGARAPTTADTVQWSQFSIGAAVAEQSLHDFYLKNFGESLNPHSKKSPTCELYTSFLLKHAALSPIEVAAASVLPCFWIYEAVGRHHIEMLKQRSNHPYERWIELYAGEDFEQGTRKARAFADRLAALSTESRRQEMTEAFIAASRMELMFWRAAWMKEDWPRY